MFVGRKTIRKTYKLIEKDGLVFFKRIPFKKLRAGDIFRQYEGDGSPVYYRDTVKPMGFHKEDILLFVCISEKPKKRKKKKWYTIRNMEVLVLPYEGGHLSWVKSGLDNIKEKTSGEYRYWKVLAELIAKVRFLRRIPKDPMTNSYEWGLRSYQDDPDSEDWGGENVYDVYTKSQATALDGTKYKDW